jgi:hypothetical protein
MIATGAVTSHQYCLNVLSVDVSSNFSFDADVQSLIRQKRHIVRVLIFFPENFIFLSVRVARRATGNDHRTRDEFKNKITSSTCLPAIPTRAAK